MRRLFFLILIGVCVSCARPEPIRSQNDDVSVVVTIDERSLGFRTGMIQITDRRGVPIEDATVTLTAVMKQHGMMNPPMTLTHHDSGYQFEKLEVNMVGEWQMRIRIIHATFNTTVEVPILFE